MLANDGDKIKATFGGITANNANSKTVKLYFAGGALDTATSTTARANWSFNLTIIRTGTTTARALLVTTFGAVVRTVEVDMTALNFTAANILKITGTTPTLAGDVTAKMGTVEWKPSA